MEPPALIASDLDGTLLHSDGTVSDRTVAVLDRLAAEGIPFVMVTGRPMRWVRPVLAHTGHRGPVVCSNGAVVWDPGTDEVLSHRPLSAAVLAEVVDRLRADLPGLVYAAETTHAMRHEPGYPVPESGPLIRPGTLAEVLAEPAIKLLARRAERDMPLTDAVARCLAGLAEVTRSSNDGLAEISAYGVTKATGLAWLADRLGVPATGVLAFGDMPNDLPMFAFAGHSVAMANAEPGIRAAADAVTETTNDADGVASYLESLLA